MRSVAEDVWAPVGDSWTMEGLSTKSTSKRVRTVQGRRFARLKRPEILRIEPVDVSSFRALARSVAAVTSLNPWLDLYFRGQGEEHWTKDQSTGKNSTRLILPTILRPREGQPKLHHAHRRARALWYREALDYLKDQSKPLGLSPRPLRWWQPESRGALLQHYGIGKTPLLDVTSSLRVAATFALGVAEARAPRTEGFLYILGAPFSTGSISHFVDQGITLVKLANVCPAEALRPHFQQGFLLSSQPLQLDDDYDRRQHNAAYRLVACYRLDNHNQQFWKRDPAFPQIASDALMPANDPFREKLLSVMADGLREPPE